MRDALILMAHTYARDCLSELTVAAQHGEFTLFHENRCAGCPEVSQA
jgi:hypothetical protein